MERCKKFAAEFFEKNHLILVVLIILVGLFLRLYHAREYFFYAHDQDLAGWFIRDVLNNKHLRLVGQETSTQGIYIGPLYYYLLIPFYLLFAMDPLGGVAFISILGLFSIFSFYYIFRKVSGKNAGLIAVLLYSFSFYTVFNDREVVPTTPVITWTAWFFYTLHLFLNKDYKKAFLLSGILIGLIWHINMALVILTPLIVIALIISGFFKKWKSVFANVKYSLLPFSVFVSPLVLFELRHNFLQSRYFIHSLTTNQKDIVYGFEKLQRVLFLLNKNLSNLVWGQYSLLSYEKTAVLFLGILVFLGFKKIISKNVFILFIAWLIIYIGFFSAYSKIVSEYYLNGTVFLWTFIFTNLVLYLLKSKSSLCILGVSIILFFVISNLYKFYLFKAEKIGYLYRKALVEEIKNDSKRMHYPCVSVSYITKPGYEFGYRYLYYIKDLHVNKPSTNAPVYTIVYPLNDELFPADKTFGALGLIYPDYARYTINDVIKSCSGDNQNITDPMWGITY